MFAGTGVKLCVRRLRAYQKRSRDPAQNLQVTTAIFGNTAANRRAEVTLTLNEGQLGERPLPWAAQARHDLSELSVVVDDAWFLEAALEKPFDVFTEE